jgi:hypothetical protein
MAERLKRLEPQTCNEKKPRNEWKQVSLLITKLNP